MQRTLHGKVRRLGRMPPVDTTPEPFRVYTDEIPERISFYLSEEERHMFAKLLTLYGISVDTAGDTFQHLYRRGLKMIYESDVPEEMRYV